MASLRGACASLYLTYGLTSPLISLEGIWTVWTPSELTWSSIGMVLNYSLPEGSDGTRRMKTLRTLPNTRNTYLMIYSHGLTVAQDRNDDDKNAVDGFNLDRGGCESARVFPRDDFWQW